MSASSVVATAVPARGAFVIPREHAAMLNPLVGPHPHATMVRCRDAVDEVGFLMEAASSAGISCPTVLSLCSLIAAALSFELSEGPRDA